MVCLSFDSYLKKSSGVKTGKSNPLLNSQPEKGLCACSLDMLEGILVAGGKDGYVAVWSLQVQHPPHEGA